MIIIGKVWKKVCVCMCLCVCGCRCLCMLANSGSKMRWDKWWRGWHERKTRHEWLQLTMLAIWKREVSGHWQCVCVCVCVCGVYPTKMGEIAEYVGEAAKWRAHWCSDSLVLAVCTDLACQSTSTTIDDDDDDDDEPNRNKPYERRGK